MPYPDRFVRACAPLEIVALGGLCRHWADNPHDTTWKAKILRLRKGVIAGGGWRKGPPPEIIQMEWEAARALIERLPSEEDRIRSANGITKARVVVEVGHRQIERGLPWSETLLAEIARRVTDGRSNSGSVARRVVQVRLGLSKSTTNDGIAAPRRFEWTPSQGVAANVYLDLASSARDGSRSLCQARLLDALHSSGFPPLAIYYLIQVGQNMPGTKVQFVDPDVVAEVCDGLHDGRESRFVDALGVWDAKGLL